MLEKLPPDIPGQRWTDLTEIFYFDGVSPVGAKIAAHVEPQT
jgi:hypothetical protein